jgi:peptide-methionine (S)-S-oxide reductase
MTSFHSARDASLHRRLRCKTGERTLPAPRKKCITNGRKRYNDVSFRRARLASRAVPALMTSSSPTDSAPDAARPPMDRNAPDDTARAAFALGCFWGPDARFGALHGVVRTCVGYAGGTTAEPTYDAIGDHIEAVRVEYDPAQIDYATLLEHFWAAHDPTRAPFKRQYQSALFPRTAAQADQARATRAATAERLDASLATEVIADAPFYRAEPYHQKHKLRRHPDVMRPVRSRYPDDEAFADAPATALINGYVGGHRSPDRLAADRSRLGLSSEAFDALRTIAERRHA